jgi:two-component system, LytTR family, sensor kinase
MHVKLPQYTKSDVAIMLFIVVPWLFVLNRLIVGPLYFQRFGIFLAATAITFTAIALSWQVHTWIAVTLRERFPRESQTSLRLLIMIPLFILVTALATTLFFWFYKAVHFPGADFNTSNYQTALLLGAVVNVFVTFIHEAVSRFEKWKAVLVENEQLKKEYMQSQLLGLKSQINPHFLFNSLNSLSCLINDDEQEAELFLDEMSKVYRYLLRNNDEELVTLHTELDFIRSYFYLLKVRYGRAMELHITVGEDDTEKCLPPLTLQMLLEDVFNSNAGTRDQPTIVSIVAEGEVMEVRNTIQKRITTEESGSSGNLENVMNKFWLLCQRRVEMEETEQERVIRIPLITEKKGKAA